MSAVGEAPASRIAVIMVDEALIDAIARLRDRARVADQCLGGSAGLHYHQAAERLESLRTGPHLPEVIAWAERTWRELQDEMPRCTSMAASVAGAIIGARLRQEANAR